jgi:hypothetical protein
VPVPADAGGDAEPAPVEPAEVALPGPSPGPGALFGGLLEGSALEGTTGALEGGVFNGAALDGALEGGLEGPLVGGVPRGAIFESAFCVTASRLAAEAGADADAEVVPSAPAEVSAAEVSVSVSLGAGRGSPSSARRPLETQLAVLQRTRAGAASARPLPPPLPGEERDIGGVAANTCDASRQHATAAAANFIPAGETGDWVLDTDTGGKGGGKTSSHTTCTLTSRFICDKSSFQI